MQRIKLIILLCLLGCKVLKEDKRTDNVLKQNLKMNTLAVRATMKEVQRETYWPDGSLYQVERVQQQVDEAGLTSVKAAQREREMKREVNKERVPIKLWIYIGVGLVLAAGIWIYKKVN